MSWWTHISRNIKPRSRHFKKNEISPGIENNNNKWEDREQKPR